MIRRPPRSTLFPTRRSSDLPEPRREILDAVRVAHDQAGEEAQLRQVLVLRSEEHTSELQSPCNLVCRLLLEKKKNNKPESQCVLSLYMQTRPTAVSIA